VGPRRRGKVAHGRDRLVGGREAGEAIFVIDRQPLQSGERPVEDACKLAMQTALEFVIFSAKPRSRQQEQYDAAHQCSRGIAQARQLVADYMQARGRSRSLPLKCRSTSSSAKVVASSLGPLNRSLKNFPAELLIDCTLLFRFRQWKRGALKWFKHHKRSRYSKNFKFDCLAELVTVRPLDLNPSLVGN
jgi:hypothetical protein